jgi:hypothetical protein
LPRNDDGNERSCTSSSLTAVAVIPPPQSIVCCSHSAPSVEAKIRSSDEAK